MRRGRTVGSSKPTIDSELIPWADLANAVVADVEFEYQTALKKGWKRYIEKAEAWFRGPDFQLLTMGYMDPEYVIRSNRNGERVFTKTHDSNK